RVWDQAGPRSSQAADSLSTVITRCANREWVSSNAEVRVERNGKWWRREPRRWQELSPGAGGNDSDPGKVAEMAPSHPAFGRGEGWKRPNAGPCAPASRSEPAAGGGED